MNSMLKALWNTILLLINYLILIITVSVLMHGLLFSTLINKGSREGFLGDAIGKALFAF